MKLIKLAFISLFLLFAVVTIFSFFIPSRVRISKAINIATEIDSVWAKVDHPDTWQEWNSLKVERLVKWVSRNRTEHIAEIQTRKNSFLLSGWKCIEHSGMDSLTVQWYLDLRLKWYPWEKFRSLLFEKTVGPQLEMGLTNLKTQLEK